MELANVIEKFLNDEITANDIEQMLKSNQIIFDVKNSIEYSQLTQPLNKKYYEIMGKGINFDLGKSYPPRLECFICLLKAIENKADVEYYYSEYWRNMESRDPIKCPNCGSNEVWKYLYGEPTADYDKEKYVLGGCVITGNNPKYKCKKCGKDIYLNNNIITPDDIKKKMEISELYPVLTQFPMLMKYFDLNSDKLLDEKIEVLKKIKEGKQIQDIPNFYDVFELLPKDQHWD